MTATEGTRLNPYPAERPKKAHRVIVIIIVAVIIIIIIVIRIMVVIIISGALAREARLRSTMGK